MTTLTGECFCGEIRYEIKGPLAPARSCHCSRCRKAFSGASDFRVEKGELAASISEATVAGN